MTLVLRGVTPDGMGWALGRALWHLIPKAYAEAPWPWESMRESSRLWHARRAQWYLDHTDRGPGQWPAPEALVAAQMLWDETEYPGVLPAREDYTPDQQHTLLEQATEALEMARHYFSES